MYEEQLKSGIPIPFPRLVIDVLHFCNSNLAQVQPMFSRQFIRFFVLYRALGILTCATIFGRYFRIWAAETNSGWFSCASKLGKGLFTAKPTSIKS